MSSSKKASEFAKSDRLYCFRSLDPLFYENNIKTILDTIESYTIKECKLVKDNNDIENVIVSINVPYEIFLYFNKDKSYTIVDENIYAISPEVLINTYIEIYTKNIDFMKVLLKHYN